LFLFVFVRTNTRASIVCEMQTQIKCVSLTEACGRHSPAVQAARQFHGVPSKVCHHAKLRPCTSVSLDRRQRHASKLSRRGVFAAVNKDDSSSGSKPAKVVGMGGVGVDYLASVAAYPKADDKLRTEVLEVQGGGNCGNALTAISRLGAIPYVISKVGDDAMGDSIIDGLAQEGIKTDMMLRSPGPSPFTYIIVDRSGGTRTCIHTPGPECPPSDIDQSQVDAVLEGASLIYFDGRLTQAAVVVAKAAKSAGVPVLVEAERLRPDLEELLTYADYVATSKHFPQDLTEEDHVADAMLAMLDRLPDVQFMVTTLGVEGSVLVERRAAKAPSAGAGVSLKHTLEELKGAAAAAGADASAHTAAAAWLTTSAGASAKAACFAQVTFCPSYPLDQSDVVDTTGAGDAFIGSVCYSVANGLPRGQMLELASFVAATKCRKLGPRPGLPTAEEVPAALLQVAA